MKTVMRMSNMSDTILKHKLSRLVNMIKGESFITIDMVSYLWIMMDAKPFIIINGGYGVDIDRANTAGLLMRFMVSNAKVLNIQHDQNLVNILTKSEPNSFNYFHEYMQSIKDKDVKHDESFILVNNSSDVNNINDICRYNMESGDGLIALLASHLSEEIITIHDGNSILNVDKLCDEKYLNSLVCVINVENYRNHKDINLISLFELGDKLTSDNGSIKFKLNRIELLYNDAFKTQFDKCLSLNTMREISKRLGIKHTDFINELNKRKDILMQCVDNDLQLLEIDDKITDFYEQKNKKVLPNYDTTTITDIHNYKKGDINLV